MPDFKKVLTRRSLAPAILALAMILPGTAAFAQIEIGFCQGQPGRFETFEICLIVCCPGDLAPTRVCATTAAVDCGSAAAVMAAVSAAMAGMTYMGDPIVGPPTPVATPVPGQARSSWPLGGAFAAKGCCVIGGSVSFKCGTMSLRINVPCGKPGGPPPGPGPMKLGLLGPPPPFPTTMAIWFTGCPMIMVPFDGTETITIAKGKILAALLAAGYTAFINTDCEVEVLFDCNGLPPGAVEEFGLLGGIPMPLALVVCPPPPPVSIQEKTWGAIKAIYQQR